MVGFGASITEPIKLDDLSDFRELIGPNSTIELSADINVTLPTFITVGDAVGLSAAVRYEDEDLFDDFRPNVTIDTDVVIAIASIQKVAEELKGATEFFDESDALASEIPLLGVSLNELIAGEDRTIADMFDLTDWANGLETTSGNATFIELTELLVEVRKEVQSLLVNQPDVSLSTLPDPPDLSAFEQVGFESGIGRANSSICSDNTNAIFVDIEGSGDEFVFTICSLLGFEFEADLNDAGLLDEYELGFVRLELEDTSFTLKGSLTFGARLKITKRGSTLSAELEFDPLVAKLAAAANPSLTFGVGLLELEAGIDAFGKGEFGFLYDQVVGSEDSCGETGYERWKNSAGNSSSFCLKREVEYGLSGQLSVGAEIGGLDIAEGLQLSITDTDVFDDIAPVVSLPDLDPSVFKDMLILSPALAVTILQRIDTALAEASTNELFMTNVPLLNFKISDAAEVGQVFTSKLYEFFVQAEPFNERRFKFLTLSAGKALDELDTMGTYQYELYVLRDLTVNPIPENAEALRKLALENGSVCNVTFSSQLVAEYITNFNNGCDTITACDVNDCSDEEGEFYNCDSNKNCDLVMGTTTEGKFFISTVAYKGEERTTGTANDIQLLGIFEVLSDVALKVTEVDGLPAINNPVVPPIVPRFKTLQDLLDRISNLSENLVSEATGLDLTVDAKYQARTGLLAASLLFDIAVSKEAEFPDIVLQGDLSLGDLASVTLDDSSILNVEAGFSFSTQVGILFEGNQNEAIDLVGTLCDGNTTGCDLPSFKFLLEWPDEDSVMVATNEVKVEAGENSADKAVLELQAALDSTNKFAEGEAKVEIVGTSTIVMKFVGEDFSAMSLFVEKVCELENEDLAQGLPEIILGEFKCPPNYKTKDPAVPPNLYGFTDDIVTKRGFQFVVGSTSVNAAFGITGNAGVSANVGDVIEIGATIGAFLNGDLSFTANENGDVIPINEWIMKVKMPRQNPTFLAAQLLVDGCFDIGVETKEPFAVQVPGTFEGGFGSSPNDEFPFVLDLLGNITEQRPEVYLDIDLPDIGDIRNLSFGDVVRLLKQALEFLVGDPEEGNSVESCSGGLLGKELFGVNIFAYKIPVVGVSACQTAGFLQVVVDAVDSLVNECNCDGEGEDGESSTTFSALATKLESLLEDDLSSESTVSLVNLDSGILELDIGLSWPFQEAQSLQIDFGDILDGLDLDEDMKKFAKGLLAFEGEAITEIAAEISFNLGLGLELQKGSVVPRPYVKGTTGVSVKFAATNELGFSANIGPLPGTLLLFVAFFGLRHLPSKTRFLI